MSISLKFYLKWLVIYVVLLCLLFGTGIVSGRSTYYPPEYEQFMTDVEESGESLSRLLVPLSFMMGLFNWAYLQFITKDWRHSLCFWMNSLYEEPAISYSKRRTPIGGVLLGILFLYVWVEAGSEYYVMGRWSYSAHSHMAFWEAGETIQGWVQVLISLFGVYSLYKLVKELYLISRDLEFFEDMAGFNIAGRSGYVNKDGKIMIQPRYTDLGNFSGGLAPVKLNGKCGFINKTGKEMIPLKYDFAEDFSDGLAVVRIRGKDGFTDTHGNEYWDMTKEQAREQMKKR